MKIDTWVRKLTHSQTLQTYPVTANSGMFSSIFFSPGESLYPSESYKLLVSLDSF